MKQELVKLDEEMNNEIKMIKDKYSCLKENVHKGQNINKFKTYQSINYAPKRKYIPKCLKILVWNKNIGKEQGIGKCYVCESEIDSKDFECGHIISVKEGGENILDNLLPICSSCNKSMATKNLHEFKKEYFKKEENSCPPMYVFIFMFWWICIC